MTQPSTPPLRFLAGQSLGGPRGVSRAPMTQRAATLVPAKPLGRKLALARCRIRSTAKRGDGRSRRPGYKMGRYHAEDFDV